MSDTSDPLAILDAIDRERGDSSIGMIQANQVQRLRDEIVALRQAMTHDSAAIATLCNHARAEALEEAAGACERRRDETGAREAYAVLDVESYTSACSACAYDIRALKEPKI